VELLVSLVWVSLFIVVMVLVRIMVVRLLMFINPGVPCGVLSGADERARRCQETHDVRLPDAGHDCQGGVVSGPAGRRAGGSPICGMSDENEWPYKRVLLFSECSNSSLLWFIECSDCVRSCGVVSVPSVSAHVL
jgi:hypothetical protein